MPQALPETINRIAADLRAFGPWLDAEAGGAGDRARAVLAEMGELAGTLSRELQLLRGQYLEQQTGALGIGATARHLKLNLGAGPHRIPGWINIDAHPADLAMDITWGLPFADGSARFVYTSHFLEHLYLSEVLFTLRDIFRVLEEDGVLRIVVPDIEQCLQAYVGGDGAFFAERSKTWHWQPEGLTRLMAFLNYAGVGPRPSSVMDTHKYGYDFETLAFLLRRVGFCEVTRTGYMESRAEALRVDQHSAVAGATYGGRHYSLFVEARK